MTHPFLRGLAVFAHATLFSSAAWGFDCKKACTVSKKLSSYAMFDSNTGQLLDGSTRFSEGESIQILFVNKNPFKYAYRFGVTGQPLSAGMASQFLSAIPGFTPLNTASRAANPQDESDCNAGAGKDLLDKIKGLPTGLDHVEQAQTYLTDLNQFIADTDVEGFGYESTETCEQICTRGDSLLKRRALGKVDELKRRLTEAKAAADRVTAELSGISASAECKDVLAANLDGKKAETTTAEKQAAELTAHFEKNAASLKQIDAILQSAYETEQLFVESRFPVTSVEPTSVQAQLFRRNLRLENASEQSISTITMQTGKSVFSISAGIGFSTLPDVRVVRQQANVAEPSESDPNPEPVLGTKFAYERNSKFKPSPLVLLNAMPWEWKHASLGFSTGVVIGDRANGVNVEYVLAASVALLDHNLFISAGAHAAQIEALSGFNIGDRVPDGLQDPIPTIKDWKLGGMLSLSYRVR